MKAQSYLLGTLVIILSLSAVGGVVYLAFKTKTAFAPVSPDANQMVSPPQAEQSPATSSPTLLETPTLIAPAVNSKVKSPLTISGSAIGTWYFEASFPVILKDAQGNVLAQTPAQAQGDWMTTSTVPFSATLTWATTTATSGVLILKKDNPSGLPQNDNEVSFPVTF